MPPFLDGLSDDEIEVIGTALADPLSPRLAVALSSACRGLRLQLKAPLAVLRQRCEEVKLFTEAMSRRDTGPPWSGARLRGHAADAAVALAATLRRGGVGARACGEGGGLGAQLRVERVVGHVHL